jgi:hypothetical protein
MSGPDKWVTDRSLPQTLMVSGLSSDPDSGGFVHSAAVYPPSLPGIVAEPSSGTISAPPPASRAATALARLPGVVHGDSAPVPFLIAPDKTQVLLIFYLSAAAAQ